MLKKYAETLIAAIERALNERFDPKNMNPQMLGDWGALTMAKSQLYKLIELIDRGIVEEEG